MTTRVTVINEETSGHAINVEFAGMNRIIRPGDSLTTHIWSDYDMKITELEDTKFEVPKD